MSREIMQQALDNFQDLKLLLKRLNRHKQSNDLSDLISALEAELAKPEQEVRWFQQFGDAPPRKPWVGLTDEDMHTIHDDAFVKNVDDINWALQMARRIEAKLKEKNSAL